MLNFALEYARRGWRVLRLHGVVNGKCTCGNPSCGKSIGKHPNVGKDWQHKATTDEEQIRAWFGSPGARNIGIQTGAPSGIVAVDIDSEAALEEARRRGLPDTLEVHTGRGRHFIYKHPGVNITSEVAIDGFEIDIRGDGAQIVAPPSTHYTGATYKWANDMEPAPLPQWIVDRQDKAVPAEPLQQRSNLVARRGVPLPDVSKYIDERPELDWGRVVDALGWIDPDLPEPEWAKIGMALHSTGDARAFDAFDSWSAKGTKYPGTRRLQTHWRSFGKYTGRQATIASLFGAAMAAGWVWADVTLPHKPTVEIDVDECELVPEPPPPAIPEPPPGIIKDFAKYCMMTAPVPHPSASLTAAIVFAGHAMGRVVCGPTKLRTNMYLVQLAGTGSGKDHPRRVIKDIMRILQVQELAAAQDDNPDGTKKPRVADELGEGVFSDSAIITGLTRNPRRLFLFDEFGRKLQHAAAEGEGGNAARAMTMLMQAFTSAPSTLFGPEYADPERVRAVIDFPHLSLLASAASDTLWPALRSEAVVSGFLPRFIVVHDDGDGEMVDPMELPIPSHIVDWIGYVRDYRSKQGNLIGAHPGNPFVIRRDEDAADLFRGFMLLCNKQRKQGGTVGDLWSRAWEQADRLATIAAVSSEAEPDLDELVATGQHTEWAIRLVSTCINNLLKQIDMHVSDTQYGALRQQVMRAFREAGPLGLTKREIGASPVLRQIKPSERKVVVADLLESGDLVCARIATGGRGRTREATIAASELNCEFLQETEN